MRFMFISAMLGFIFSAAVNVITYFGSGYGCQTILIVALLLIGLVVPFISKKEDLLTLHVSVWYKIIAVLLVLYSLLLFVQPGGEPGVIIDDNGRYLRENRGKIIREATQAEFMAEGLKDTRLASSLTMVGFFVAGMIYLSKSRE